MKVTAKATRSGGWWAVEVPEVPGAFTQVKRLDQVGAMAADAVATLLDVEASTVEVVLAPATDHDSAVAAAREASARAAAAQDEASLKVRAAVGVLRADGLTARDVATLLGISHQRVSQLEAS